MKHAIIGSGVVGVATGTLLEANGEEVEYYDNNHDVIMNLKKKGKNASEVEPSVWDIAWVCTHEKNAFKALPPFSTKDAIVVVRSTVPPNFFDQIKNPDILDHFIHFPEFLRERTSISDTFNPNYILIGAPENSKYAEKFISFISEMVVTKNIHTVPYNISSLIKLISNAYLSTQISFWNEVYMSLSDVPQYRQVISDILKQDPRISDYGSLMLGKPFSGKCLPKDLDTLLSIFDQNEILNSVKTVNEKVSKIQK